MPHAFVRQRGEERRGDEEGLGEAICNTLKAARFFLLVGCGRVQRKGNPPAVVKCRNAELLGDALATHRIGCVGMI
jgi:hypothetical protein